MSNTVRTFYENMIASAEECMWFVEMASNDHFVIKVKVVLHRLFKDAFWCIGGDCRVCREDESVYASHCELC